MAHSQPVVSTHYQTSIVMLALLEPSCVLHAIQLYNYFTYPELQVVQADYW